MILYGQTSSGKTFTLFGDKPKKPAFGKEMRTFSRSEDEYKRIEKSATLKQKGKSLRPLKKSSTRKFSHQRKRPKKSAAKLMKEKRLKELQASKLGIIPRYLESLFEKIGQLQKEEEVKFTFEYSFFEIYREKIYDLLNQTYEFVEDEKGEKTKVLKALNLREKTNNQMIIGGCLTQRISSRRKAMHCRKF